MSGHSAASYARYSTDKQRDASIADQERNNEACAAQHGDTIALYYRDRAESGSLTSRTDYQRMLADAGAGHFGVLYLDDLYRLGRDDVEMKEALRRLIYLGVRVVSVDGYDSGREGHELDASVRGLIGNIYLVDLRKKVHRGLTGQALAGHNCGGRSYGYRHVPIEHPTKTDAHGRPVIEAVRREIDEDEAQWIRWIFEQYAAGQSPKRIAAELNRSAVPAPRGGTWSFSAIYGHRQKGTGILNNPLYIGQYIWNRSTWVKEPGTGKRKRRERPESEWIVQEIPGLRIVDQALWERVKARQAVIRQRGTTGRSPKYLFSGLLRCGVCGARYTMISKHSYGCASVRNRGDAVCSNRLTVSRTLVESRLLDVVKRDLLAPEAVELFRAEVARALNERAQHDDRASMQRALAKAEREITNIMTAIKAGVVTPTTKAELERAEADRDRLKARLDAKPRSAKVAALLPGIVSRYRDLVADLAENIPEERVTEARACLEALLGEEIRLDPHPDGYLVAGVAGDYAGLLRLASSETVVAGAGFRTFRTIVLK